MLQTSRRAKGFTLVEVVVSLGVLSLILLATVSALRTFANTQVSLDRMLERVDEVRTVSSFLRDMLEGAMPGKVSGSGLSLGTGSSELAYFKGTPVSIEWKAPVMFGEAYGGTMILRLAREGKTIKLYWQEPPQNLARVNWDNTSSRVLVDQVEQFQITYRPELKQEWRGGQWDENGAPALVRLSIKANGRYWPDLIIGVQR